MTDISTAFTPKSEPIIEFFQRPGVGFYIPLYQRSYSWDEENVKEFVEDIAQGVKHFLIDEGDIHFLGTVIKVVERNPEKNIQPKDARALPETIDNIIDGQQRISTFALLAALLYQRLEAVAKELLDSELFSELDDTVTKRLSQLKAVFTVDLERGTPSIKPIVIRGSEDMWTLDGNDSLYVSDVSNYLANVIRAIQDDNTEFPSGRDVKSDLVSDNLKFMESFIKETVENAHLGDTTNDDFPAAAMIISNMRQELIWLYDRPELRRMVEGFRGGKGNNSALCSFVQLLAFCHYMLHRCCLVTIRAENEEWAYDMFQSLNATGTPLTAVETFKPTVVNRTNQHGNFKDSLEAECFEKIDECLKASKDAAEKTKITNEFLITYALSYNGYSLPRRFSTQKRWLEDEYRKCETPSASQMFVRRMGNVATFQKNLKEYVGNRSSFFDTIGDFSGHERQLVGFCLLYLEKANHRMARTILSLFYSRILDAVPHSQSNFVEVVKAVAAFFTLWRSATSNAGLDDAYRKILAGKHDESIQALSWTENDDGRNLTVENVKTSLRRLLNKHVNGEAGWKNKAATNLIYRGAGLQTVCRFSLFITSKNVVADKQNNGLMYIGQPGSTKEYWTADLWRSRSVSVEHITPRERGSDSSWDGGLYDDDILHTIGNLTLLPSKVNQSLSNKQWITKWIYYRHLAEKDSSELEMLNNLAEAHGVILQQSTIELLKQTPVNDHIASIVAVGIDSKWDKDLVQKRTERLCSILWKRLYTWLQ